MTARSSLPTPGLDARDTMAAKKIQRRARRPYRPSILALEPRALLAEGSRAFSVWQGDVAAAAKSAAKLQVQVDRANFQLPGGRVLLGILASPVDPRLDPARIQLSSPGHNHPRTLLNRANVAGGPSSLLLESVGRGTYSFSVRAAASTSGGVDLGVYLAGDVDSDFRVTRADLRLIQSLYRVRIGDPRYATGADVNRDGVINKSDTNLARQNLGVVTRLRPLELSASLDAASAPDASGAVSRPDIRLVGVTRPGARVRVVRSDLGTVEGALMADAAGGFQFGLTVGLGVTPFQVTSVDRSGQRRVDRQTVVRREPDVTPPSVALVALPEDVLTTANVTLGGRVSDDRSAIGSLRVQVDSGPLQDVPFDPATGGFSYSTALSLDGTADGAHLVQFVATDAAGNVSGPVSQSFRLDTQAPSIAVLSQASGRTVSVNPTVSGRVTDAVSGVGCLERPGRFRGLHAPGLRRRRVLPVRDGFRPRRHDRRPAHGPLPGGGPGRQPRGDGRDFLQHRRHLRAGRGG